MKFTDEAYSITKDYAEWLRERKSIFRENTKTNKILRTTLVTTWGLRQNANSGAIQKTITLEDLFQ
ncbi:MAG: ATPase [Bacteroidaceae bacterium]|nr:ATPase [Bacteroidaceae bacterium]